MDARDQFVATVKELFETDDQTFNTTYSLGYYNSVRSNTYQGKKPARYSDVQMLWEVFRDAYQLGLAHANVNEQSQAQQESQWISVEERLPETKEMIISARKRADGTWGLDLNYWTVSNRFAYNYTHWIPLPPAPEGEKE